ncbi:hypothetical protein ACGTRS_26825 [Burkholderia semiarida]|uniref:Uncharacterized protein n=1 Tax=Burkholderia semiarida TaxID=2843303 RepID=A0ABW7L9U5_9BURK
MGILRCPGCDRRAARADDPAHQAIVGTRRIFVPRAVAPAEVEEIFEFPFAALLNPDLPRQYADGKRAGGWYWADQPRDIRGVTAFILKSLAGLALDAAR